MDSSVSMGGGSQRSLEVGEKKEVKPGVQGNMMGPEDGLRDFKQPSPHCLNMKDFHCIWQYM
ncbi:hypothetical protein PAMP_007849 [Pampus punctatissimus]